MKFINWLKMESLEKASKPIIIIILIIINIKIITIQIIRVIKIHISIKTQTIRGAITTPNIISIRIVISSN